LLNRKSEDDEDDVGEGPVCGDGAGCDGGDHGGCGSSVRIRR
jgi:hypothetical protein